MGYEVARSFKFDLPELSFSGSFASSNVTPRTFERWTSSPNTDNYEEYDAYKDGLLTKEDIFIISVLSDIVGGSIQFNKSVSVKYRYALHKMREFIRHDNAHDPKYSFWSSFRRVYDKNYNCSYNNIEFTTEEDYKKDIRKLKKYADYFFDILDKRNPSGEYIIELGYGYVQKVNPTNYLYVSNRFSAKKYKNLWEAELDSLSAGGKVINSKATSVSV